jgi:hypothetical protein
MPLLVVYLIEFDYFSILYHLLWLYFTFYCIFLPNNGEKSKFIGESTLGERLTLSVFFGLNLIN